MYIGNDGAGADTNLAAINFYNPRNYGTDDPLPDAAFLLAYAQYLLPASDTYVHSIQAGPAGGHGQFPVTFPTVDYAALVAADSNLDAMTAYGVRYGFNDLTARGIGAVITRKTTTVGRHGRGRLTTPWLPVSAVTSEGQLLSASAAVPVTGWGLYMNVGSFFELLKNVSAVPYLPIVGVQVSGRLGHVRSRTK
jgi:hypothetical protein